MPYSTTAKTIAIIYYFYVQGEVLQESQDMIPDCQKRIRVAYADLQTLMVS